MGGWEGVAALRRGREPWVSDERVLGSSAFTTRLLEEMPHPRRPRASALPRVVARVAEAWGLTVAEVTGGSRREAVVAARYAASYLGVRELGLPAARVARALGVSLQAVLRGAERGAAVLAAPGVKPTVLLGKAYRK